MTETVLSYAILLGLSVFGVLCVVTAAHVQDMVLRQYERHPRWAELNPFLPWMRKPWFVWYLRAAGVFIIAFVVFVILLIAKGFIASR